MGKVNILFVCSRNKWRSATAETIFKGIRNYNVKSAGTEPSAVVKNSAKSILCADLIFAMEKKHRESIKEKFPLETGSNKIIVLDIEDDYQCMDTELIETIRKSVEPYLDHL